MRAWGLVIAALPLAVSCHEYRTDPKMAPASPPASAAAGPARAAVPEWVPAAPRNAGDPLAPTTRDPDGGALVNGQRIAEGGAPASQIAAPPLVGGVRVPRHLGAGFLFWSNNALYFARKFAADLEPVVAIEPFIDKVSFGAGYALVSFTSGARFALSWPGRRRIPLPVAGLVDGAALADGRALILVEPDLVLSMGAGQKTWRDVSAAARPVAGLFTADDTLWLKRVNGSAARLEADGSLSNHSALPNELLRPTPKPPDPRWPSSVSELPLGRAVRRGVPVDEHTAVVEVAGAFARVDLGSGALLDMTPAVLASAQECELLPVEEDVLALCRTTQGTALVVSGVKGPAPKIERTFGRTSTFFAGSLGTLLFAGPCEERTVTTPVVCVRQRDRSWRELGEPLKPGAAAGDAGTARPAASVLRWVPTRDGGALGLVAGPTGGLLNAATGELTRFTSDQHTRHSGLFSSPGGLLVDDLALSEDGKIVGYIGSGSLALHSDGRVDQSPQSFRSLRNSGALALAHDGENRLWQSNDFGLHWVEVARPPGTDARQSVQPERCSRVGCELPGWYRLGYHKSPPSPARLAEAARPTLTPRAKTPRLVCERSSPPRTRWVTRARNTTDGVLTEEFDFGARKVNGREGEIATISLGFEAASSELSLGATLFERALGDSSNPGFGGLLSRNRTLRFVDPLGDSKIVEGRFSWQDVFTRAVQAGNEIPTTVSEDRRNAIPVLVEKSAGNAGLLIQDPTGVLLWARPGQAVRILSLGRENVSYIAQSAAMRGKDELLVLAEDDSCGARVVSVTGAGARTLLELPARPSRRACPVNRDALALADDGSIAVLRMPSSEPPSADDPALSLKPGQKPVALAPWSSLGACGSDAMGIRALVATPSSWVALEAPGLSAGESFTFAVVRWSEGRVCAESVAVGAAAVSLGGQEFGTMVLARFGTTPRADRRGFAQGAEHTEDLTCKLAAP